MRALWVSGLAVQAMAFTLARAQTPVEGEETAIDTIVVTGTRIEQTTAEAGSTVRVIDADRLEDLGFDHALDAIATTPGVTINQNGPFGGSATVRIRGASSDQTLVLIDGVSVNDASSPGGGFNFARLDTAHIERIEILSGPQSTLWGTDAIGGVVSIITKRPDEGLSGGLFGQTGSFGAFRGGASVSHGGDTGDFRLAATQLSTGGISKADEHNGNTEDDGFDSLTLSAQGGLNLPGGARIDTSVLWNDSQAEFDSFRAGAQGSVGDGDEVSETMERSAHVSLTAPLFGGRLDNRLLIGRAEIDRQNLSNGSPSFDAQGERTLFRYQGTLDIDARNTLAAGAEREESTANVNSSALNGLFALYEFRPADAITLTGGVRSDDHERFGSETTARFAASYRPSSAVTLRGSWGQGFKAPTIFQSTFFCCGATAANEALRPERSEGVEAGIDWRSAGGRAQAGITLFRQDTENRISFSFGVGGYENIAEVQSEGIEVTARWVLNRFFELQADYAYIEATEGNGNPLLRLPKHSGDLLLDFDPPGAFSSTLLVRYNGSESDRGGAELDAWTRVDVNVRYELSDRFEVYGRIENLLDAHYQQILGYGTPGRSGSVGARWQY
ncbi:MAG: TonB-dependent receptor [Proteobacteria bacterium]|nr:TonB-dependent receptor [Pseudomonadota bacterium]